MPRSPRRAWLILLIAAGLLPAALASTALAEGCGTGDIPLGELYLSFLPDEYDGILGPNWGDLEEPSVPPFTPFPFYLVVNVDYCDCGDCSLNLNQGFQAWEAGLDVSGAPDIVIISAILNPPGSYNFGGLGNFLVVTGGSCVAQSGPFAVVTFSALINSALGAQHQRIKLMEASPASRLSPGWNQCSPPDGVVYSFYSARDGDIHGRRSYEDGSILINPVLDPVTRTRWGAIKAGFGQKP